MLWDIYEIKFNIIINCNIKYFLYILFDLNICMYVLCWFVFLLNIRFVKFLDKFNKNLVLMFFF